MAYLLVTCQEIAVLAILAHGVVRQFTVLNIRLPPVFKAFFFANLGATLRQRGVGLALS